MFERGINGNFAVRCRDKGVYKNSLFLAPLSIYSPETQTDVLPPESLSTKILLRGLGMYIYIPLARGISQKGTLEEITP